MNNSNKSIVHIEEGTEECHVCGGRVVPVLYGEPTAESFELAGRGMMILRGCCITADEEIEDCACKKCHQRYMIVSPSN